MSDIAVTYDLLFDVLRNEKSRDDLQKLDEQFYTNVVEYINSKEQIINNPSSPHGERELTRIQLSNVKKLLVELYDRREKKIINLAIYKIKTGAGIITTEGLLSEERQLFDTLTERLGEYRGAILHNIISGKNPEAVFERKSIIQKMSDLAAKHQEDNDDPSDSNIIKSIRFTKPVPRFLGPELETYGPFEENDIASLPSKIANVLIRKERAEAMNVNLN
ncbi:MAG TPA: hypothetical protein VEC16_01390 [Alphaproteobacteria bacterium]|nr:hypothetical protein [Alphaproteobacteria bacterium]